MLLFTHITLINAKDHYDCGLRGVLASSFQDIVPEEKELLFCRTWLPRNVCKSNAFICCLCREWEGGGLHTLKNPLTQYLALKNKVFLGLQEHKKASSHLHFE